MVTEFSNKAIEPSVKIPGPELVRMYVSPTIPNGERLKCGSCHHVSVPGHEIVHAKNCPWLSAQKVETK